MFLSLSDQQGGVQRRLSPGQLKLEAGSLPCCPVNHHWDRYLCGRGRGTHRLPLQKPPLVALASESQSTHQLLSFTWSSAPKWVFPACWRSSWAGGGLPVSPWWHLNQHYCAVLKDLRPIRSQDLWWNTKKNQQLVYSLFKGTFPVRLLWSALFLVQLFMQLCQILKYTVFLTPKNSSSKQHRVHHFIWRTIRSQSIHYFINLFAWKCRSFNTQFS